MENSVYLRMRYRIQVRPEKLITIGDIAQVISETEDLSLKIKNIPLYQISAKDKNIVVLDVMAVIKNICKYYPQLDIQTLGPSQSLVEIVFKKKKYKIVYFVAIWFLLFVGAALTIMNFHEDVSMQAVHQKLYHIITGEEVEKPLLLQIPYSIGLGLGMILFFNHIFKKRINEEPSPLEVEMFNYQQDLDNYLIMNENKESMKKLNDN